MKIQRKCNLTNAIISLLALFAICILANTYSNITVYGQLSQNADNNSNQMLNTTTTQNVTDSNIKNAIPYVLNVTNSSDATSQAVDQVIQAVGGGQSTLKEVIDAASSGNSSPSSLEQVIDAASSVLNNQSSNTSSGNMSNNTS